MYKVSFRMVGRGWCILGTSEQDGQRFLSGKIG